MANGSTTEISLIGKEGMVGTLQFIGDGISNSQTVVQVKGTAMRIESQVLQVEFNRSKILRKLLLGYTLELFNQVSQGAACNNHHTVKQRTARWLLMLDDRSENRLSMTHQLLSQMLGVRRTGVSEVANDFKQLSIVLPRFGCKDSIFIILSQFHLLEWKLYQLQWLAVQINFWVNFEKRKF